MQSSTHPAKPAFTMTASILDETAYLHEMSHDINKTLNLLQLHTRIFSNSLLVLWGYLKLSTRYFFLSLRIRTLPCDVEIDSDDSFNEELIQIQQEEQNSSLILKKIHDTAPNLVYKFIFRLVISIQHRMQQQQEQLRQCVLEHDADASIIKGKLTTFSTSQDLIQHLDSL